MKNVYFFDFFLASENEIVILTLQLERCHSTSLTAAGPSAATPIDVYHAICTT